MPYLYGASIQGIQDFIFETGVLKEIVGASELVDTLCSEKFENFLKTSKVGVSGQKIEGAAGLIKYLFQKREDVEKVVLRFPIFVEGIAPGITVSQAVEETTDRPSVDNVWKLEQKLAAGRNRPRAFIPCAISAAARSPRTGKAATTHAPRIERGASNDKDTEFIDSGTVAKLTAFNDAGDVLLGKLTNMKSFIKDNKRFIKTHNNNSARFPTETSEIASVENSYMAIIHADGNGMGAFIKKMFEKFKEKTEIDILKALAEFSNAIGNASEIAANKAFELTILNNPSIGNIIPLRPIVLAGDDFTFIIRADIAVPFAIELLKYWEEETKTKLTEFAKKYLGEEWPGFTACAGIAFVKATYPFKDAYAIAEDLCGAAKKVSKANKSSEGRIPSSFLFFRQRSSIRGDYHEMVERELITGDYHFDFGPYGIDKTGPLPSFEYLMDCTKLILNNEGKRLGTGLREWFSLVHDDYNLADSAYKRLLSINDASILHEFKKALSQLLTNYVSPISQGTQPVTVEYPFVIAGTSKYSPIGDIILLKDMGISE